MPILRVGQPGPLAVGSSASITPSFGQPTTAGNLLICLLAANGTANPTAPGWVTSSNGVSGCFQGVFYQASCTAAATAPTLSCTASTYMVAQLFEFTGALAGGLVDRSSSNILSGPGTNISAVTGGVPDVSGGELFIIAGALAFSSAIATTFSALAMNNGAVLTDESDDGSLSAATHYLFGWGITTSNVAVDTFSGTSSSSYSTGRIGAFSFFGGTQSQAPYANVASARARGA